MQNQKKNTPVSKKSKNPVRFQVQKEDTLLAFLIASLPDKSRTTVKSYLSNKQIHVNDLPETHFDRSLSVGDMVEIKQEWIKSKPQLIGVKIVFEDEHLIVIEKEAGLLSIATETEKRKTAYSTLSDYVKDQNRKNRIFVVHRLDRETSGLMLFAKSEEVQERIQRTWSNSVESRNYVALVEGNVEKEEDTIVSWLKEGKTFVVHACNFDNGGQKAVTHYKVMRRSHHYTLLDLSLETGRKNQIRVQLQSIGHPVTGDKKYGAKFSPIKRLALHAYSIEFFHPITGEKLIFKTPIPKQFYK